MRLSSAKLGLIVANSGLRWAHLRLRLAHLGLNGANDRLRWTKILPNSKASTQGLEWPI